MVAIVKSSLSRWKRSLRREGLISSIRSFAVRKFFRTFRARLCVWVWNHGDILDDGCGAVTIERYVSADAIPARTLAELIAGDGETFVDRMNEEFSEGGVLWVGIVDGDTAGYQWSRRGHLVKGWHFQLSEQDVLIYSTVTFHAFRGQRVARMIMAEICRAEVESNGRACADCMVWNTPAVRFIEKTGFAKVAERKPLAGHPD